MSGKPDGHTSYQRGGAICFYARSRRPGAPLSQGFLEVLYHNRYRKRTSFIKSLLGSTLFQKGRRTADLKDEKQPPQRAAVLVIPAVRRIVFHIPAANTGKETGFPFPSWPAKAAGGGDCCFRHSRFRGRKRKPCGQKAVPVRPQRDRRPLLLVKNLTFFTFWNHPGGQASQYFRVWLRGRKARLALSVLAQHSQMEGGQFS